MDALRDFLDAAVAVSQEAGMESISFPMTCALAQLCTHPAVAASLLLCDVDYHLSALLQAPAEAVCEAALAAAGDASRELCPQCKLASPISPC